MDKVHNYNLTIIWTGNKGTGTSDYRAYERSHIIQAENKADIAGSSDPAFRGDKIEIDFISCCRSFPHNIEFPGMRKNGFEGEPKLFLQQLFTKKIRDDLR